MENTQKIVLRPKDHKKGHKRVLISLINTGEWNLKLLDILAT